MKKPVSTLLALLALFASSNAFAAGGISCAAKAKGLSFELNSGVTHGMGAPLFNFSSSLQAELGENGRVVSINHKFGKAVQYWNDAKSLNLVLYSEAPAEAKSYWYTKITITTQEINGGETKGNLALVHHDVKRKFEGKMDVEVTCSRE